MFSCAPHSNSFVEVLTYGTLKHDLVYRRGLYRGNFVKIRSLGWVLTLYDWYSIKGGNLDTDLYRGETT